MVVDRSLSNCGHAAFGARQHEGANTTWSAPRVARKVPRSATRNAEVVSFDSHTTLHKHCRGMRSLHSETNWAAIVPMANEAEDFQPFVASLTRVLDRLESGKIYFVVDTVSKDNTWEL